MHWVTKSLRDSESTLSKHLWEKRKRKPRNSESQFFSIGIKLWGGGERKRGIERGRENMLFWNKNK